MSVLFDQCITGPWKTAGADVQYRIEGDMLIFQQTVSELDWAHNFLAIPVESAFGEKVHAGFYSMLCGATEILDPFKLGIKIVTGFSQGGALAQLYAAWFGLPCVTFGSPKVFYKPKRKYPQIVRYEKRGDIVTMLPLRFSAVGQGRKLGWFNVPNPWAHHPAQYQHELREL